MADTTNPDAERAEKIKAAVTAWHDADTDEKKAAAVKAFPVLVEIYAAAADYQPKS